MNIDMKLRSHVMTVRDFFINSLKIIESVDSWKTIWRSSYYSQVVFQLNNSEWILVNAKNKTYLVFNYLIT